ncbi:hypothetical protein HDV02_001395 [Globomyces sp. JEL0801]|nr:hypothetical protein HDV02_001395 [Globomyces sp. JEL0801]
MVYMYWDYRKEFSVSIYGIFNDLNNAISYAESLCDEEDFRPPSYTCQQGQYFDRKEKDSNYGRIAVDEADVKD